MPIFLRPITYRDVRKPKAEIRQYIQSKTGSRYENLRSASIDTDCSLNPHDGKQDFPFLERLKSKCAQGLFCKTHVESDPLLDTISRIEEGIHDSSVYRDPQAHRSTIRKAHRLLNIELMMTTQ